MKLEENRALLASRHVPFESVRSAPDFSSWVVRQLPGEVEKFVALAPGRLDVLGGIAEYTGGLVLAMPLSEHACVGVQRRTDGLLKITHLKSGKDETVADCEIPMARLRALDETWLHAAAGREVLGSDDNLVVCCAGTVVEALRMRWFGNLMCGLTLAVATDLGGVNSMSPLAATSSALLVCLAALAGESMEPNVAAHVAQVVENEWLGLAVGPSGALCGLLAEAHQLMQLRCDNRTLGGALQLPNGLRIVAVECGGTPSDHVEKFMQVRTATFMGRFLIDRIVCHERMLGDQWDGHLSRISVNDFVERLRDRLPTRMLGRDFLDRFGETGDRLTKIDPNQQYKIRSRTEHHVYEHARSRQFVEAISRGSRNGDRSAFLDAGSAMNASHWSCGQRCGMGSVRANSLVSRLRKAGPAKGIFGARIAGWGCGGMVVALADDTQAAQETIENSLQAYVDDYNVPARILSGSLSGAMVSGAVRV